jgi:predicted nucleotidyltransferase component of viral defense system
MSPAPEQTEPRQIDLQDWIRKARVDPLQYRYRQVVEILLHAVGKTPALRDQLYLKGGTLMALAYHSPRFTGDLDFTGVQLPTITLAGEMRTALDAALLRAAATLGYVDLVCKVQRVREAPRAWQNTQISFPALTVTIGFAERGSRQHTALQEGKSTQTVALDINFNEPVETVQTLLIGEGSVSVQAYGLPDLIAEKLRALLQQTQRQHPRARRQDIYDIALLIRQFQPDADEQAKILDTLRIKSAARDVIVKRDSLADPEVRRLAGSEWQGMKLELEELPDFATCYAAVQAFYEGLPWEK